MRVRLERDEGVVGDRWARRLLPDLEAQVTAMRADVARLLEPPDGIPAFGDNLFLDLDLSEPNLPPGTLIAVGSALCVVTAKPHTGCRKFAERAGREALEWTKDPAWRAARLRGIHLRVVEAGEVGAGDAVEVRRQVRA
jgi:MOSC domain-containing protein YiiM